LDYLIDLKSGVPFYRQIIEQVKFAIASGTLASGDRLPTVRQLAVDLSINPNTVIRAYREMEIEGVHQILTELLARASGYGFTVDEVLEGLRQRKEESQ
jgi:GntR family transcriptional regulator